VLNESDFGAHLDLVRSEDVHPHEIADPGRESRIEVRLRADGQLRDPLIVGAVRDFPGYLLLDGTNRRLALRSIGLPWAMVQVIDYHDRNAVELRTWCHAAPFSLGELREAVSRIACLYAAPVAPLDAVDALATPGTVALALDGYEATAFRLQPDHAADRTECLRQLVRIYELQLTRVDCDPDELEHRARVLQARGMSLIAFPAFSRPQVLTMAERELLIPAGITRHIILSGRALRVNLPLDVLAMETLDDARTAFRAHLSALQPRIYRETTILYDS
jgi:hypothetical protein